MRVLVVMGTRPEAIKLAPVVQVLQQRASEVETHLCLTGQHRELLRQALSAFDLEADHDLDIMTRDQHPRKVTRRILKELTTILEWMQPDIVLVQGDTTTAFAAALAAFYADMPVAHVEAGLRTYRKDVPYPEEIHRRIITPLCDLHFAPTASAKQHLLQEGTAEEAIHVTGNTVIDALLQALETPYTFDDPALKALGSRRRLLLVTAHRRENQGVALETICQALREITQAHADMEIACLLHPSPVVRSTLEAHLQEQPRIHLLEPMEYIPFIHLLRKADAVLTDSGGVQEEATALGIPLVVLNQATSRMEGVQAGKAWLTGTKAKKISVALEAIFSDTEARSQDGIDTTYGDGKAAKRIVEALLEWHACREDKPL